LALPRDDPEARQAARFSVDAFLEAGDKIEAATSLMQLSRLLEHESPHAALEQLDAMLKIVDQHGLIGSELRAALHHARGNRLLELHAWDAAMEEGDRAVALRRGVLGAEDKLISSLHLALIAAKNAGHISHSEALDQEARGLEKSNSATYFELARRVASLFEAFDLVAAESLLAEARTFGHSALISATQVLIATRDPKLSVTDRLGKLERALRELEQGNGSATDKHPLKLSIATVLRDDGQYARAVVWLRNILRDRPLDVASERMLLDCLWKSEDWNGAAECAKGLLAKHGEHYQLLYAYGRSLVELGDHSAAVPILTKAMTLSEGHPEIRDVIHTLRERALVSGGTILPASTRNMPATNYVTRTELEHVLRDYARFIAAEKRMRFWTRELDNSDYEWIPHPERLAQDFLHGFLNARFGTRGSIFEELSTGAGRLDIYLKFEGGLSAVVELKMCGFRYSSAYAAAGEEQIHHYMENRSCHLGYLVVHDARLDHFESALIQPNRDSINSVVEIFVDVRPRVRRHRRARASSGDD
jgi:tetratricopeptide (TPR) repeat protein